MGRKCIGPAENDSVCGAGCGVLSTTATTATTATYSYLQLLATTVVQWARTAEGGADKCGKDKPLVF